MFRYCPDCDKWLETSEYTVDEIGETICPEHEIAVHGSIQASGRGYPVSETEYRRQNQHLRDGSKELEAAKRQRLVE